MLLLPGCETPPGLDRGLASPHPHLPLFPLTPRQARSYNLPLAPNHIRNPIMSLLVYFHLKDTHHTHISMHDTALLPLLFETAGPPLPNPFISILCHCHFSCCPFPRPTHQVIFQGFYHDANKGKVPSSTSGR